MEREGTFCSSEEGFFRCSKRLFRIIRRAARSGPYFLASEERTRGVERDEWGISLITPRGCCRGDSSDDIPPSADAAEPLGLVPLSPPAAAAVSESSFPDEPPAGAFFRMKAPEIFPKKPPPPLLFCDWPASTPVVGVVMSTGAVSGTPAYASDSRISPEMRQLVSIFDAAVSTGSVGASFL